MMMRVLQYRQCHSFLSRFHRLSLCLPYPSSYPCSWQIREMDLGKTSKAINFAIQCQTARDSVTYDEVAPLVSGPICVCVWVCLPYSQSHASETLSYYSDMKPHRFGSILCSRFDFCLFRLTLLVSINWSPFTLTIL